MDTDLLIDEQHGEKTLGPVIEALNAVFARADVRRHVKLQAVATNYLGEPVIRFMQASSPKADPQGGMYGRDRRCLASAFKAAGFDVGESKPHLSKSNKPAVLWEPFRPEPYQYGLLHHFAPWEAYMLKPDASFVAAQADTLAQKLIERYSTYVPA